MTKRAIEEANVVGWRNSSRVLPGLIGAATLELLQVAAATVLENRNNDYDDRSQELVDDFGLAYDFVLWRFRAGERRVLTAETVGCFASA